MQGILATNYPVGLNSVEIAPGIFDHDLLLAEINVIHIKRQHTPNRYPIQDCAMGQYQGRVGRSEEEDQEQIQLKCC